MVIRVHFAVLVIVLSLLAFAMPVRATEPGDILPCDLAGTAIIHAPPDRPRVRFGRQTVCEMPVRVRCRLETQEEVSSGTRARTRSHPTQGPPLLRRSPLLSAWQ